MATGESLGKIWAIIRLFRPPLLILGFLASYAILRWSGGAQSLGFAGSLLLVSAIGFGNLALTTLNEIGDVEVDRINKPEKPLPSGEVSVRVAWVSVAVFALLSLFSLSYLMARDLFYSIGLVGLLTGLVYNTGRKDLWGNLCLGATYGVAALMAAYPNPLQMVFSLPFALFTVGHNILVQWQDYEADRLSGLVTTPIQLGGRCIPLSGALCSLSIIVTLWLFSLTIKWFLILFVLANVAVITSLLRPSKRIIEWSQRRVGRLLITTAFLWMIIA